MSSLLSFVSAGTHGRVVFNLQNALLRTLIRARSLAFAAFLGARLSKSSLLYFSSETKSLSSASNDGVEARRFRGMFNDRSTNASLPRVSFVRLLLTALLDTGITEQVRMISRLLILLLDVPLNLNERVRRFSVLLLIRISGMSR